MSQANFAEPHSESLAESSREKVPSLIESLEQHFQRYAALAPGLPLVLALWSVATQLHDGFDCFPYLAITSPTKRCGKTRTAELLEFVCANPLRTVGISVAALFRVISKKKRTLLIDEAESLRGRDERASALREILNAGYKKGQKVIRCEGGNGKSYQTREFETFCPKVLILIGTLPDTLADRCIPIQMKRRTSEQLGRFRFAKVKKEAGPLHARAKRWANQNRSAVERWYEVNDVTCLEDREAELWLPLFAVCAMAAPDRLPELRGIALKISGAKSASEPGDCGIKLLADVREIFDNAGHKRLSTAELVATLNLKEDSPWQGWSEGEGLDARSLSRMLRPFDIAPKNHRLDNAHIIKGYDRTDFDDAWSRYLGPVSATAATGVSSQQDSADSSSATESQCSGSGNEESANVYAACSGVAAVAPETVPSFVEIAAPVPN